MNYDAIIIGAGAAGLFCAVTAGKRGRRVLVIEHNAQVGRKILISGGGRCNFTNTEVRAENFVSANPHFCKSALARFTPADFVALVRKHGIEFYEKKLGQLFCKDSARRIIEMLLAECRSAKVTLKTGCTVKNVRRENFFTVETNLGEFTSEKLVVASGGLSFPKIGATDFGYQLAKQFGLKIIPTNPALVPLVFKDKQNLSALAGVSADSMVKCGKTSFRENILFTHRGLSGPAVLQISNYWNKKTPVRIDLLPDLEVSKAISENIGSKQSVGNFLSRFLPHRLVESFFADQIFNRPLNRLGQKEIVRIADKLHRWEVFFGETEGYHKAEVTGGGVSTDELSSNTMETKICPGLYFIGEVVDVTGWLGGYNFQWAWSSGFACGSAI